MVATTHRVAAALSDGTAAVLTAAYLNEDQNSFYVGRRLTAEQLERQLT